MADNIGQLAAQNFAIPQQPAITPQVTPVVPPLQTNVSDEVQALEGIQHITGMTEGYYQKVAALKGFMNDAMSNYGIDVRVPDASRPESIELNSIFRNALADVMAQGNLLKTSNALNNARDQRGVIYAEGFDPTATPAAEARSGTDFFENKLRADVESVNAYTRQRNATFADREAIYNEKKAELEAEMQRNPEQKSFYEMQLRGLTPPPRDMKLFNPNAPASDKKFGRDVKYAGNAFEKFYSLQTGTDESFRPDPKTLTDDGVTPYLVSTEFANTMRGNRAIARWLSDPTTGKTLLEYQNGDTEDISGIDPATLTADLGGASEEATLEYVDTTHGRDTQGRTIVDRPETREKQAKNQQLAKAAAQQRTKVVEDITRKLNTLTTTGLSSRGSFPMGGGKEVLVEKGFWGNTYYISEADFEKAITIPTSKVKKEQWKRLRKRFDDGVSKADMIEFILEESSLLNDAIQQTTPAPQETTQPPSPTPQPTTGGPAPKTQAEFDSVWTTLKPGEQLLAPNGVTYTKK